MPLERLPAPSGAISLSVERKLAGPGPSRDAVVGLAGGPGQAALPLAEAIGHAIAPALSTRDLLVFDQRGTGTSDPLSCPAFERSGSGSASQVLAQCAQQLGPARGGFTTQESVQDIEALRKAGGYEKLVLYGTSYGTKVALEYAESYPQYVEALVLDSVVPAEGWEPLHIASFQAIPGVLSELCENRACAGVTTNPVADIAQLVTKMQKRALSGSVYDGAGHRHPFSLDALGLMSILEAGDLNPALRALAPAAVHSALRGDPDPLLRLRVLSDGLSPSLPNESPTPTVSSENDEALFVTTLCEESPFPWSRTAGAPTRLAEATAFLQAQPASAFYPFSSRIALQDSLLPACSAWPDASPTPPATSPLPNVPTLILSGEQDLRTPTANARRVASLIPDAQLLTVPFTGHSVIGSDLDECAAKAVSAFFAPAPVQPCPPATNKFAPTPLTPTRLAYIHPPSHLTGRPGKTLVAALDALVDLNRQVIGATLQINSELPSGASFGGLRGGYARLTPTRAILHDFSFVPGVELSGSFPVRNGALQLSTVHVFGAEASAGTVRIGSPSKLVTGTLGGRSFDVSLAKVKVSSVGEGEWPSGAGLRALLGPRSR